MPRKRTRAASAKEQADYQAPLNQICENVSMLLHQNRLEALAVTGATACFLRID